MELSVCTGVRVIGRLSKESMKLWCVSFMSLTAHFNYFSIASSLRQVAIKLQHVFVSNMPSVTVVVTDVIQMIQFSTFHQVISSVLYRCI